MIAISARLDDRAMIRAFRRMKRKAGNLTPVLRELRPVLRDMLAKSARAEESPDGAKWAPRAGGSKQRYKRSGKRGKRGRLRVGSRRRLLGRLPRAVDFVVLRGALVARSKVAWAAAQQRGGRVGRGSILPAREFLTIPDAFIGPATARLRQYVLSQWGR